jgi:septum formation protein
MRIILGSSSPRRKDILSLITGSFDIIKPETDESVILGETAHAYCSRVARDKLRSLIPAVSSADEDILLIASDTTVSFEDHILGKPEDQIDAIRMISLLQGRTHQVLTSLALYARRDGAEIFSDGLESTDVRFKTLGGKEIELYLSRIHYMDKAGAYAAQEQGDLIIERIEGSVTNVIGFPLRLFFRLCSENGILDNLWGLKKY